MKKILRLGVGLTVLALILAIAVWFLPANNETPVRVSIQQALLLLLLRLLLELPFARRRIRCSDTCLNCTCSPVRASRTSGRRLDPDLSTAP